MMKSCVFGQFCYFLTFLFGCLVDILRCYGAVSSKNFWTHFICLGKKLDLFFEQLDMGVIAVNKKVNMERRNVSAKWTKNVNASTVN